MNVHKDRYPSEAQGRGTGDDDDDDNNDENDDDDDDGDDDDGAGDDDDGGGDDDAGGVVYVYVYMYIHMVVCSLYLYRRVATEKFQYIMRTDEEEEEDEDAGTVEEDDEEEDGDGGCEVRDGVEAGVVGAEGEGGRRLLRISFIVGALWRFNWENLSVAPIGHPF